jgi:hypothetical protein
VVEQGGLPGAEKAGQDSDGQSAGHGNLDRVNGRFIYVMI